MADPSTGDVCPVQGCQRPPSTFVEVDGKLLNVCQVHAGMLSSGVAAQGAPAAAPAAVVATAAPAPQDKPKRPMLLWLAGGFAILALAAGGFFIFGGGGESASALTADQVLALQTNCFNADLFYDEAGNCYETDPASMSPAERTASSVPAPGPGAADSTTTSSTEAAEPESLVAEASGAKFLEAINQRTTNGFSDAGFLRRPEEPIERLSLPVSIGGTVTGGEPGLYGGTRDSALCDPEGLVEFLNANPDKAAAWAAVQGIEPEDIEDFVAELTPVILVRDTEVTNHGFVNGQATPHQAILQAGTAVMVDRYGVPVVKCSCGNPVREPDYDGDPIDPVGTPWPEYDPDDVVKVTPEQDIILILVVVDADGGPIFWLEPGSNPEVSEIPPAVLCALVPQDPECTGTSSTTTTTSATATTPTTSAATTTTQPATTTTTQAPVTSIPVSNWTLRLNPSLPEGVTSCTNDGSDSTSTTLPAGCNEWFSQLNSSYDWRFGWDAAGIISGTASNSRLEVTVQSSGNIQGTSVGMTSSIGNKGFLVFSGTLSGTTISGGYQHVQGGVVKWEGGFTLTRN